MTAAAFKATFCDFRLFKGRKVASLMFEVPIELADAALKALGGVPQPMSETWVAIATLDLNAKPEKPAEATKPKRAFAELSRPQQAGILCADEAFQQFVEASDAEGAARVVRVHCNIDSRTDLDRDERTKKQWDDLVLLYRQGNYYSNG